jgi:hypothetical protein
MAHRFTFFRSYYESLQELSPEDFKAVVCAVCAYAFDGIEPELDGIRKSVFVLIKPNVEKSIEISAKRSESGTKGAEKTNQQKHGKQSANERQTVGKRFEPEEMIKESELSEPLKDKVLEWLEYKKERREPYKERGLRSMITEVRNNEQKYGSTAVIGLINKCMASGWKGIIWDILEKDKKTTRDRMDVVDKWVGGFQ